MPDWSDATLFAILEAIDAGNADVNNWEAEFLESQLLRGEHRYTPKERAVIMQMHDQYLNV